jgi:hypothetical protein
MKAAKILSLTALVAGCASAAYSQVYSQNIVGYINQSFYAGDNYFANQLSTGDNSLDTIFTGAVPQGATFTEWDPTAQQFLPISTFTGTSWSINYSLTYGQGGLLDTPSGFVNTFTGGVWSGFSATTQSFTPPLVTGTGSQLLSCYVPITATFYDVIGRGPANGESVTTLAAATQTYTTTTFSNGVWDNGAPELGVGEAAFFNLDVATPANLLSIPEPSVTSLAAVGAVTLLAFSTLRRLAKAHRA